MQLIILYGAPGVGKLTVATELMARTGYRLFHNHLTVDLALVLFPFGTEPFNRLSERTRVMALEEAARSDLRGVIFTFVYGFGEDDASMQKLIDAVEMHGGSVRLVLLTCERETMLERVTHEGRAAWGKLRDRETAAALLERHVLDQPYPHRSSLVIDTTDLAPGEAAGRIVGDAGREV